MVADRNDLVLIMVFGGKAVINGKLGGCIVTKSMFLIHYTSDIIPPPQKKLCRIKQIVGQ